MLPAIAPGRRRSDRVVGSGRAMQEIVDSALAAANASLPVCLSGPEGSGREHIARAIHSWSTRAGEPFIAVSCAAINEGLVGREIFGCAESTFAHLPGEYAGALSRAAGGTLFLESAHQLADSHRQSLAKALVEVRFQREGDGASFPLRARLIVSSERDGSPLGDLPQLAIRLLFSGLPASCYLIGGLLFARFSFNEREHADVRRELEARAEVER